MTTNRLLFASIHSYLDPSSGAALATRELLELLAAHGWDCRALTCGVLDYQQETPLDDVLSAFDLPTKRGGAALSRGGQAEVFDLELDRVRVTLLPTAHSRAERAPSPYEAGLFLDLACQVLNRFRPQVLLTYGGHPVSLELMRRARAAGLAVVFHLHNFGYNDRRGFTDVSTVIFPSAMANGIPVLASDRGALPETLGDAGFVFTIPERCTPTSGVVPTAQEVAPWVAVIERLWDDPEFEASHRERARIEARRWNRDALGQRYQSFFLTVGHRE